jgi:hypothetical protein
VNAAVSDQVVVSTEASVSDPPNHSCSPVARAAISAASKALPHQC